MTNMTTAATYRALFTDKELLENLQGIILDNKDALTKQYTRKDNTLSVTVLFADNSALIINKRNG